MNKWISVDDRLPEFNLNVIVWCGWADYGSRFKDSLWPSSLGFTSEDGDPIFHVTHWMPMPEGPK